MLKEGEAAGNARLPPHPQGPKFAQPGEPGKSSVQLELKLMADVGLLVSECRNPH